MWFWHGFSATRKSLGFSEAESPGKQRVNQKTKLFETVFLKVTGQVIERHGHMVLSSPFQALNLKTRHVIQSVNTMALNHTTDLMINDPPLATVSTMNHRKVQKHAETHYESFRQKGVVFFGS